MKSRRKVLKLLVPGLSDSLANDVVPPKQEIVALNRLTYGATTEDIDKIKKKGIPAFIEEQLNPGEEGEKVTQLLSSITLPIKYAESQDKWPAVDESRPLSYLNANIEKLWPLTDNKTPMANQEKVRPLEEVRVASWVKAVYSPWQLREVMVEFWHNHFNVNASSDNKIATVFPIYDRDVIRKNCFGNFRAYLEDVAKSAAMLYYLDNFTSKASPANENYARELFELHTLGSDFYFNSLYNRWRNVPGALEGKPVGYIDEDVYEAARSFTGWTIADGSSLGRESLPNTGNFYYYDGWHDNYQKRVLGNEFSPNQPTMADGLKVLDLVAYHPATAKHLCKKLCTRFISDEPSEALINGAAKIWTQHQKSPDQIKQTLRYILLSKEFTTSWGKKVKRPFNLMASVFRATSAEVSPNQNMTGQLNQMGYFHYSWPTPTGHPDKSSYWLNSNSMLARWNTSVGLLNSGQKLATYNFAQLMPEGTSTVADVTSFWIQRILQKEKSPEFVTAMIGFVAGKGKPTDIIPVDQMNNRVFNLISLLTMTPDFQLI